MQIEYSEQSILDLEIIIEYISKDSIGRALLYADFLKTLTFAPKQSINTT